MSEEMNAAPETSLAEQSKAQQAKTTFVRDLLAGSAGIVRDWFLLTRKEEKLASNGKPFLTLAFADRTGEIAATMFDTTADMVEGREGDIVKVEASTEKYNGKPQLKPRRIWKPPADRLFLIPDISHFYRASTRLPQEMYDEVMAIIGQAMPDANDDVHRLLVAILTDPAIKPLFLKAPAAVKYHHSFLSGLLEHSLSLMNAAVSMAAHYQFNLPLVLAGCLLHDIGKCWEIDFERGSRMSLIGRLHGHIAIGFSLVDRFCDALHISEEVRANVLHIIASHHGCQEHGSPVEPATVEAVVFHTLDKLDATLQAVKQAEELPSDEGEEFTGWIPQLRTRFVRSKTCEPRRPSSGESEAA